MEFPANYLEKLAKPKTTKGIHGYSWEVANEICTYLGSHKEFGLWVKIAQKIGAGELKAKLKYVKERGIKSSHYLLKMCSKI